MTQWLNSALEWMNIPLQFSHHFVRKLAHFAEYSLLGGLLTASVWSWFPRKWKFKDAWLPIVIGGCLASLDEWLQTFVPGRYGCLPDVLLDMCGVTWAAIALSLFLAYRAGKSPANA